MLLRASTRSPRMRPVLRGMRGGMPSTGARLAVFRRASRGMAAFPPQKRQVSPRKREVFPRDRPLLPRDRPFLPRMSEGSRARMKYPDKRVLAFCAIMKCLRVIVKDLAATLVDLPVRMKSFHAIVTCRQVIVHWCRVIVHDLHVPMKSCAQASIVTPLSWTICSQATSVSMQAGSLSARHLTMTGRSFVLFPRVMPMTARMRALAALPGMKIRSYLMRRKYTRAFGSSAIRPWVSMRVHIVS